MCRDYEQKILKNIVENKKYNFEIKFKNSFLLDFKIIRDKFKLKENEFKKAFEKILNEINEDVLNSKNNYSLKLDDHEFDLRIEFDKKENTLFFVNFDKLVEYKEIIGKGNYIYLLLEFSFSAFVYFKFIDKLQPIYTTTYMLTINILILLLFFYELYKEIKGKKKTIWVDEDSFDIFRKWFRKRVKSDSSRFFYFLRWINIWGLCLILVSINYNCITCLVLNLIIVILLMVYSINHLLKMFNLDYLMAFILISMVFLIGFLSEKNWGFVLLIIVVINQLFSSNILYISKNISKTEQKWIFDRLDTYAVKQKEIMAKLQISIFTAILYLFLKIYSSSFITNFLITIKILSCENTKGYISMINLGIERIVILVILVNVFMLDWKYISEKREKFYKKCQIIVNFISSKIYGDFMIPAPEVIKEMYIYPNEKIEPKELIKNLDDLPKDIKIFWRREPKFNSKNQKINVEIIIRYSQTECYNYSSVLIKKE